MAVKMALLKSVFSLASRISFNASVCSGRFVSTNVSFPTYLKASLPLFAEPLKKKKKLDPAIVRAREERKKRRIEKSIKKLEKNARQLKPIEEAETPISLLKEKNLRSRSLTLPKEEEQHHKALLKAWTHYKYKQHLQETRMIDRVMSSQQKALEELKAISEDLYQEAIQLDLKLVPFTAVGPSATPKIEKYESPDGDYIDVSPKWK